LSCRLAAGSAHRKATRGPDQRLGFFIRTRVADRRTPGRRMPQREFANQKALIEYAEQNGLAYLWEGMHAFAKRQQQLSPEQYEIAEVRASRGVVLRGCLTANLGSEIEGIFQSRSACPAIGPD